MDSSSRCSTFEAQVLISDLGFPGIICIHWRETGRLATAISTSATPPVDDLKHSMIIGPQPPIPLLLRFLVKLQVNEALEASVDSEYSKR